MGAARVRLLGIPSDVNSSLHRGPAAAPARIRAILRSGASNGCAESQRDVLALLDDAGDVEIPTPGGWDEVRAIERAVAALAAHGDPILSLGGDHSVTFPILRALRPGHPRLTLVHFDAHPDLYDEFEGSRLSHACPFARILEERLCDRLVQVGIRTLNPHQRAQVQRFGVEGVPLGAPVPEISGPVYVSVDLDALDPAFAPGVSHHEPGGLTSRELITALQGLRDVIGADVVEYNPSRDVSDVTAAVCVKLVKELADRMLPAGA